MSTAENSKNNYRRSFLFMVVLSVVLIGGATAGWYWLAGFVETKIDEQIAHQKSNGNEIFCAGKSVRGFPFRIGLFCDSTAYINKNAGFGVSAGQLRTAAQFYNPGFSVAELDGPADLGGAQEITNRLDWQLLRASTRMGIAGVKRLSIEMKDAVLTNAKSETGDAPLFSWSGLEFHARPGSEETTSDDLEAALSVTSIKLGDADEEKGIPIHLEADGVLHELNRVLHRGDDVATHITQNGLSIQFHRFNLRLDGGGVVTMSGPVKVGTNGRLTGKVDLAIGELDRIAKTLQGWWPQLKDTADTMRSFQTMLGNSNSDGKLKLSIAITNGQMRMGFIPLGEIPPLF